MIEIAGPRLCLKICTGGLSRWADEAHQDAFAAMKMALLACMRGNPILYNGEELGLTQVDIPFDQLQDPEAIANWPLTLSRDGVRTRDCRRLDSPRARGGGHRRGDDGHGR